MSDPDTTLVIPCYNEETRFPVEAFRRYPANDPRVRFLLVDDGSRDGTLRVLEELARSDPDRFSILPLTPNGGKGEAVRQGLMKALDEGARRVGFLDCDLATPLEALEDFHRVMDDRPHVEMIFGARVKLLGREVNRRLLRHYLGRVFATATSLTLGLDIYDSQCGAKMFRASRRTRSLFCEPFLSRWIFDVEILARYLTSQPPPAEPPERSIYELPLHRWTDVSGSKLKSTDFVTAFFDLIRIWRAYLRAGATWDPLGDQRQP